MYGFELIKNEPTPSLSGEGFLYRHKSGARLMFIKNNDENRVVMPVFKTPPKNDRGAAHVTEHCTLCGSEKYPLKDPFNLLERGSLYTYLNAITYEDKTVYPVAGTDPAELKKMARVYADGIFKPLFLTDEGIFMQEGVYRDKYGINGVVLNEMRGILAGEEELLRFSLKKALYRGSSYQYYSGGVPGCIEELSYNELKEFYYSTYRSDNCLIYIYGDVNIEEYMELYDRYLTESAESFSPSLKVNISHSEDFVRVKAGKEAEGICGAVFGCCMAENWQECVLLRVLADALICSENSILKERLCDEAKAAVKIRGGFNDEQRASYMFINAEGAEPKSFRAELEKVFKELAENGVPKDKIKASADKLRFYITERDFGYKPTGLYFGLELMKGLLYTEEPSFKPVDILAALDKAEQADYEGLTEKYFIGRGIYGYTTNEDKERKPYSSEINDKPLRAFQAKEDSSENLKLIPAKNPKELKPKPIWIDYDFSEGCLFTSDKGDIVYLDLVYPLVEEDVSAAALYGETALDFNEGLREKINAAFGSFNIAVDCLPREDGGIPLLKFSAAFFKENIAECVSLINSLIKGNALKYGEKLDRLLLELRADFRCRFALRGCDFAINRCLAAIAPYAASVDMSSGIGMYQWLKCERAFGAELERILHYIANTSPIAVLRGSSEQRKYICSHLSLVDELPKPIKLKQRLLRGGGFIAGGNVNCNCLALKIREYNGYMLIAEKITEKDYIWNKIRSEGGAYGGGCRFLRNGCMYMYSLYDPKLKRTIDLFKGVGQYLAELRLTEEELNRYIIGAASEAMKPCKNNEVNSIVLAQALLGRSREQEIKLAEERLACTMAEIRDIGLTLTREISGAEAVSLGGDMIREHYGSCIDLR